MRLNPGHRYRIAELLPHGPGFLLLDRLVGYDAESTTCEVTIRPDSRFSDGSKVPAWAGLEYMAQALGAYCGISRLQKDKAIQIELLLGTRAFDCAVPEFPVGARLEVRARQVYWDPDGACAFACEIRQDGAVVATAEIKGFEPDDIEPFLRTLTGATA